MTIVSAFHNRADAVDLSMGSLAQQQNVSFRAVVVDDGSSDGTWASLQRWRSDNIEVRRQANRGFTATLIALCEAADTELIALHGAGDESLPNRLAAQVSFLRAHPTVVAVGCGIENVDELEGRRWEVWPPQGIRPGPIVGDFGISHGEVMFRRDAYLRTGGYRSAFPVGQASDLFRRLSRLGDFGYVNKILYRRYLRHDGVSANIDLVAERLVLAAISTAVHQREIHLANRDPTRRGDQLDRHGLLLPYFADPDRDIACSLATAAMLYWSAGNVTLARRLARRSLAETWTSRGWLVRVATLIGVGPLRRPMDCAAVHLSRGKNEFARTRLTPVRDL